MNAAHSQRREANNGIISLAVPILASDTGRMIGPGGKQANFIRIQSGGARQGQGLEFFSVDDRVYKAWGKDWVNVFIRGPKRAVETTLLLMESTRHGYNERNYQKIKDSLETALHRIQELEERLQTENQDDYGVNTPEPRRMDSD